MSLAIPTFSCREEFPCALPASRRSPIRQCTYVTCRLNARNISHLVPHVISLLKHWRAILCSTGTTHATSRRKHDQRNTNKKTAGATSNSNIISNSNNNNDNSLASGDRGHVPHGHRAFGGSEAPPPEEAQDYEEASPLHTRIWRSTMG